MENNEILLISGPRGSGKSLFTTLVVGYNEEKHFLCNYDITGCENYEKVRSMKELEKKLQEKKEKRINQKRCLVIDEAQKLFNSRDAMSKKNKDLLKFIVESRKYGTDVILICQEENGIDKQIREQADKMLTLKKIRKDVFGKVNITIIGKEKDGYGEFRTINYGRIENAVQMLKMKNIEYDTNESCEFY